jgi:hypothetical protein
MAKWEIIEDIKFKKQTGGKAAATRAVAVARAAAAAAAKAKLVKMVPDPIFPTQDNTKVTIPNNEKNTVYNPNAAKNPIEYPGVAVQDNTKVTIPDNEIGNKNAFNPFYNVAKNITKVIADHAIEQKNYDEAYKWTSDYMNSPMYKKMLMESSANTGEFNDINNARWSNFKSIPPLQILPQPEDSPERGGQSWSNTGQIELFPMGFGTKGTDSHEISHSVDRPTIFNRIIPKSDINYIQKNKAKVLGDSRKYWNNLGIEQDPKYFKEFYSDYVGQDTETRARLNSIRQGAQQNKLYDPFKQKVTPEIYYNKLKNFEFEKGDKSGFDPMEQLKGVYSDEEIIYMLNHISENKKENDGTELDNLPKAQKGLIIKTPFSNLTPTQPVQEKSVFKPIPTTVKPQYKSEGDYLNQVYGEDSGVQLPGQSSILRASQDAKPAYDVAKKDYASYKKDFPNQIEEEQEQKTAEQVSQFLKANPSPGGLMDKVNYIKNLSPADRQIIENSYVGTEDYEGAKREYLKNLTATANNNPFSKGFWNYGNINQKAQGIGASLYVNKLGRVNDLLNVPYMIGEMTPGVVNIPYNLSEGNYGAAAMGLAGPLALAALTPGAKGFSSMANNLLNPLAGIVDANTVKGLGNKALNNYGREAFTPMLDNVGVEALGAVNLSTLKTNPFINTVEPQASFFSRNPSVFTNRTIPQETIDLSRREVFRRIGERQPTTRRAYTLGNEEDLLRFNVDNNYIPPPPSEYQSAINLGGVNFSEAELNAMNVRDIARGLQDNINTFSNMSRIDLDALTPYKNLTLNQLVIKNPSLAEKLKNAFKGIKSNIKNVADKTSEKLTVANQKLGEIIEPAPIIDKNKFELDLQENLNKGVGIKKGDTQIQLKEEYPYNYQVHIKTPGETNFINSGEIRLSPVQKQRSFTDILLNKNKYQGLKKPYDFPLGELKENPNFNLNLPEYKGISAEIGEATKQALKNQNKKFDLLSSKGHTDEGGTRYLTEFLNGRKPAIDISGNKEWLEMATKLKNSLKGKPIKKEEVKKILAGDKYGASPNEEYKAILKNKLFPKGVQFKYKEGGIIEDPMGQWAHPGSVTRIPSNQITMKNVNYPVLGVSDKGHTQMMYPGEDYSFKGKSVTEYPMMAGGGEVNFTYAGENHRVYEKESPTGNGKGIEGHIMVNHPTENKKRWDTIDLTKITNGRVKTVPQGVASTKKWHKENPEYADGGKVSSWEIIEDVPKAGNGLISEITSTLNPKNWGVPDYTDKYKTWNEAYSAAKKAGLSEIMWNKGPNPGRKNLDYAGTPAQEMKSYGITPEQRVFNPSTARKNLGRLDTELGYETKPSTVFKQLFSSKNPQVVHLADTGPDIEKDAFRLYLGLPQEKNSFTPSKYQKGAFEIVNYNQMLPEVLDENIENLIKTKGNPEKESIYGKHVYGEGNPTKPLGDYVMGKHTVKKGEDDKGEYIEYIDNWDLDSYKINPFSLLNKVSYNYNNKIGSKLSKYLNHNMLIPEEIDVNVAVGQIADMVNKPLPIYGRVYYKDYGDGVKRKMYYTDNELKSFSTDKNNKNFNALDLQKELVNRGYELPNSMQKDDDGNLKFDGIYGNETKQALQDFQSNSTPAPKMAVSLPGQSVALPPQFQSGGKVVSEIWKETTGSPWSEAKKLGLTQGGYEENLKLRSELLKNPDKFISIVENNIPVEKRTPTTNTNKPEPAPIRPQSVPTEPAQNPIKPSQFLQKNYTAQQDNTRSNVQNNERKVVTLPVPNEVPISNEEPLTIKTPFGNLIPTNLIQKKPIVNQKLPVIKTPFDNLTPINSNLKNLIPKENPIKGFQYSSPVESTYVANSMGTYKPEKTEDSLIKKTFNKIKNSEFVQDVGDVLKNVNDFEDVKSSFVRGLGKAGILAPNTEEVKPMEVVQPKTALSTNNKNITPHSYYQGEGVVDPKTGAVMGRYVNIFSNTEGQEYIPTKNVGEWKKDKSTEYNSSQMAHYLLDMDLTTGYQHPNSKKWIEDQKKGKSIVKGSTLKEQWLPVYVNLPNGHVKVNYKTNNELTPEDRIASPLRQYKFGDLDWKSDVKSTWNKSSSAIRAKTGEETNLIKSGKNMSGYGQFGGGSFVLLSKNPTTGEVVIDEFAGSLQDVTTQAKAISKLTGQDINEIVLGYYDVGSWSVKPQAKDHKLGFKSYPKKNKNEWESYQKDGTGAGLAFPFKNGGKTKKSSWQIIEY